MRFAFPITKTEKLEDGRLLIEGTATSEALDSQGDILDYEGSKAAFAKWRGNLREAHDSKKPVGKALEVMHDDGAKTIGVRAFVSAGAQDTQAKVLDGTLAMFSVGGDAPRKTKTEKVGGKQARRVLEWDMVELSLVDVGANPDAAFTLGKGMEASDAISEAAEVVEECQKADIPPPFACKEPGHKDMTPAEHKKAHAEEEEPEEKAKDAPAEKAAEPEIKKFDGMAAFDLRLALDCLSMLEQLISAESGEAGQGKPEPPKQMKALVAACAALKEFIASEAQELLEPAGKARGVVVMKFEAAPFPTEGYDAIRKDLAAILAGLDELPARLSTIQKSAPPAPEPDARIETVLSELSSLQKTAGETNAVVGGLNAIRDEVAKSNEGIAKMLAQPAPGRAPMRMQPAIEKSSTATPSNEANLLRRIAAGAPYSMRDFLLNEANAIERG